MSNGEATETRRVEVEIVADPDIPSEWGVFFKSEDGSPLSPQSILDACIDALQYDFGHLGVQHSRVHMDS